MDPTETIPAPPQHETVLIVEDDATVRSFVADLLHRFGYEVIVAANSLEAVEICEGERHIDLLFTDVVMPGRMSGIALAKHAQQHRPGLKVLLTSGFAGHASGTVASEFSLIQKPYRIEDLSNRVRAVLDGAGCK